MPWAAGSVCTALIGNKIYAAGGIVGSATVDDCAVYDIGANTWTPLASMPFQKGRNHAATGTDGQTVYVFGGRGVGSGSNNVVANGFDHVQIYDPATNTWSASFDPGSTIPPLPIGRGGTGKAVFYKGEFYVIGGETLTGPGAQPGNVYNRVDVYDPVTKTWRLEAKLPTPRHGIFPVIYQGKIYVAGGGTNAGFSSSNVLEIYSRQ
jgi:N-acetylneuraminic acid mutarotase